MPRSTLSKAVLLLLAALVAASAIILGGQALAFPGAGPPAPTSGVRLKSWTRLAEKEPALRKIQGAYVVERFNAAAQARFGPLAWEEAILATYEGTNVQEAIIPIASQKAGVQSALFVFFGPNRGCRALIFEMALAEGKGLRDPSAFSGTISLYTPDGDLIASGVYDRGAVVRTCQGLSGLRPSGVDWECFLECITDLWQDILKCALPCGLCLVQRSPAPCIECLLCVGEILVSCFLDCWNFQLYLPFMLMR